MLDWLRNRIRGWLDDGRQSSVLECTIERKLIRVKVVRPCGLRLMVMTGDGTMYLVDHKQAVDRQAFWRAWARLNPNRELYWEDGTKCNPEDLA